MKKILPKFKSIYMKISNEGFHISALKYAEKHPEGFTLGELCSGANVDNEECKAMRAEFVHSGIFRELNQSRTDDQGAEQNVYVLSFEGKSQLLAYRMHSLTDTLSFLTFLLLVGLIVQIVIAKKQSDISFVQSIPEQINQAQSKSKALEFCAENPEALDSGLVHLDGSGKIASCAEIKNILEK